MKCPKCGGVEFKDVKEVAEQKYKQCANCKYSPSLEHAESLDAGVWFKEVAKELEDRQNDFQDAVERVDTKPASTLLIGRYNKAKRLVSLSESKMQVAEAVSEIVGATQSGQITLLLPELGLFQFEYGSFDLFKAVANAPTT